MLDWKATRRKYWQEKCSRALPWLYSPENDITHWRMDQMGTIHSGVFRMVNRWVFSTPCPLSREGTGKGPFTRNGKPAKWEYHHGEVVVLVSRSITDSKLFPAAWGGLWKAAIWYRILSFPDIEKAVWIPSSPRFVLRVDDDDAFRRVKIEGYQTFFFWKKEQLWHLFCLSTVLKTKQKQEERKDNFSVVVCHEKVGTRVQRKSDVLHEIGRQFSAHFMQLHSGFAQTRHQ